MTVRILTRNANEICPPPPQPSGAPGHQSLHVWLPKWNMLHAAVPASRPGQDPSADSADRRAAWVSVHAQLSVSHAFLSHKIQKLILFIYWLGELKKHDIDWPL